MNRVRVVDNEQVYKRALRQREVFHGSNLGKSEELTQWPARLLHIGKCTAAIYRSNKALGGGEWVTYKHIAEAGQDLFMNVGNTRLVDQDGFDMVFSVGGERAGWTGRGAHHVGGCSVYEVSSPMPKYVSVLARDRGLQAVLHDGSHYEVRLPRATWGSGVHTGTGETFLVLYSSEGVHFLVTGDELDVTGDGIVG